MPPKATDTGTDIAQQTETETALPEGALSAADAQALANKNSELEKQLTDAGSANAELQKNLDDLSEEKSGLDDQIEALTKEKADLADQLSAANSARDSAQADLATLQNAPSAQAVDQGTLRQVGPLPGQEDTDEDDAGERIKDLGQKIQGDTLIVFSDGASEIRGVKPIAVSGPIWERKPAGWALNRSIIVEGPAPGSPAYEIRGVGLFDDEDDQVAWTEFPDPIRVPAGGKMELKHSIIFN